MAISATQALWFLPFVLPICLYVAYTDLAEMRITNPSVLLLAGIFVVLGIFLLPFNEYLWRLAALVVVLVVGIILNAAGALGAGDAKFAAAAAPYIALGDLLFLLTLLMGVMLSSVCVHRVFKHTRLRDLAPHWKSWQQKTKFPMGLALGPTLAIYLLIGALQGA